MSECLNASLVEMGAKKEHVYAHIRFKYCRVLRESRALRSHQNQFCQGLALPSIFHPLPTLSAFLFSSSVPSHLYPPAFSPIYDFNLPLSQYSFPHISHHPSLFLPFTSLVLSLLSSPLILIISTFRLPLAAFSLSASALLSLIHSAPAHCLSLACSSAHLSPFCLRLAEMDTLPGKQVKKID